MTHAGWLHYPTLLQEPGTPKSLLMPSYTLQIHIMDALAGQY